MAAKWNIFTKLKAGKSLLVAVRWSICILAASGVSVLVYTTVTEKKTYVNLKTDKAILTGSKDTSSSSVKSISVNLVTETLDNPHFFNIITTGPGIQVINSIKKENADCSRPILISDSIIFSPNSPNGPGNIIEMYDNKPDDTLYLEKEHNTVWYQFTAKETGNLTFDIIPMLQNDDYDFILYRYNGHDFSVKFANKAVKPVRTCISRNNKKLKSMTGLTLNESAKTHIHSGLGLSYVKYLRVTKGDKLYLLVDNVNNKGKGHSIRFHYKTFAPGELYVGQQLTFSSIKFMDSDYKFKKGSEKALDSIYKFLTAHPTIKIEVQGHVNKSSGSIVPVRKGEYYTELQLSKKRAETICEELISKGIDPARLASKGLGSLHMINPIAKTPKECSINIRAEIVIISLVYKE